MMGKNLVETIMGGFVLVVAGIFLAFAYLSANLSPAGGYPVKAAFSSVDGLTVGSDVRIGGVKIGIVTRATVDSKDYRALLTMNLEPDVKLPVDSKAVIASAGLLGGRYVKIEPGHAAQLIKAGGTITHTEGAVVLEELLGKIIFLATDQGQDQSQGQGQAQGQGQGNAAPSK
jgi:phospholipid/cholesterol/gamma-HCH transport system substrate-binding protein